MNLVELLIADLSARHPGVTSAIAHNYLEAATVCLTRHHISPIEFLLTNDEKESGAVVKWTEANERTCNAWANADDATRDGAYACALAAIELTNGSVAVRRAETLTGADYYVASSGDPVRDVEHLQRLEVSGTDMGSAPIIFSRVRVKVTQTQRGNSNLPAIVCVVGFHAARIVIQSVDS